MDALYQLSYRGIRRAIVSAMQNFRFFMRLFAHMTWQKSSTYPDMLQTFAMPSERTSIMNNTKGLHCADYRIWWILSIFPDRVNFSWSRLPDSNRGPTVYKTVALTN